MARITFAAPVIRAALATLEARFPTHVAAFNAEAANDVELVAPVAYAFGALDPMTDYPVVEASLLGGQLGPFDVHTVEADSSPTLNLVIWLMGTTGEVPTLYEQALGYARCAIEILVEADAFGPDYGIANEQGAIDWRILGVLPAEPADKDRTIERWRIPVSVQVKLDGVERWQ